MCRKCLTYHFPSIIFQITQTGLFHRNPMLSSYLGSPWMLPVSTVILLLHSFCLAHSCCIQIGLQQREIDRKDWRLCRGSPDHFLFFQKCCLNWWGRLWQLFLKLFVITRTALNSRSSLYKCLITLLPLGAWWVNTDNDVWGNLISNTKWNGLLKV